MPYDSDKWDRRAAAAQPYIVAAATILMGMMAVAAFWH